MQIDNFKQFLTYFSILIFTSFIFTPEDTNFGGYKD